MIRLWRPETLRDRLTLWYGVALISVLLAYAVVVFFFLRHSLWQQLDEGLHEDIETTEAQLHASPAAGALRDGVRIGPGDGDEDDPWVEVWSVDGRRLLSARAARHRWRRRQRLRGRSDSRCGSAISSGASKTSAIEVQATSSCFERPGPRRAFEESSRRSP